MKVLGSEGMVCISRWEVKLVGSEDGGSKGRGVKVG